LHERFTGNLVRDRSKDPGVARLRPRRKYPKYEDGKQGHAHMAFEHHTTHGAVDQGINQR
jgi:hypothetical protein